MGKTADARCKVRALLLIMVVSAGLAMSRPAQAACCSCSQLAYYVACVASAVTTANAVSAQLVAYITGVMLPLHVKALSDMGAAVAGSKNSVNAALYSANQAASQVDAGAKFAIKAKEIAAENQPNTLNLTCRLATAASVSSNLDDYSMKISAILLKSLLNLASDGGNTPERLAIGHLNRLCRGGLLTENTLGKKWFDNYECFSDDVFHDGYLSPVWFDKSWVVVPPSTSKMAVLDNVGDYPANQVKLTWDGLTSFEKKFVVLRRYCENLALGKIALKGNLLNVSLSAPENQALNQQKDGMNAAVITLVSQCFDMIAERTGIDTDNLPPGPGWSEVKTNAQKMINFLLKNRGVDPRLVLNYPSNSSYNGATNPIGGGSPKIWVSKFLVDRYMYEYGLDSDCPNFADAGSQGTSGQATTTGNAIACRQIAENYAMQQGLKKLENITLGLALSPRDTSLSNTPMRAHYFQPEGPRSLDGWKQAMAVDATPGALDEAVPSLSEWLRGPRTFAEGAVTLGESAR